ncbi:MAG: hypothetical protein IPP07_03845 [Holophagales bacterium]|nr:hypothetical protein [Holophagales bacterium]MBK9964067.1 hypothetical protein [Holophagales bacterium]
MKKIVLALTLAAATSASGLGLAAPQDPASSPMSATASSPLVEDITRLWRANLSEEFISKYFAHSDLARDLTPQDIVVLRSAGVPETLITSITLGRSAPGTAAKSSQAVPGPADSRRWDGLALRNSGIVILKSRWDSGTLEFKEGSLRWVDSRQTDKNLLLPMAQVTEQQLTCLKKAGGNECFEWVVKTRNEEHRFRDTAWRQGENTKVQELFDFFRLAYPGLISSRNPVDEK